jgi:hypothetical protein
MRKEIRDMKAALFPVLANINPLKPSRHLRDELAVAKAIVKVEELENDLRFAKRKLAKRMSVFMVKRTKAVDKWNQSVENTCREGEPPLHLPVKDWDTAALSA